MGIVILFALVFIGAALVFVVGSSALDAIQAQSQAEQTEQELKQFDADLATLKWQDGAGSVYLGDQTESEIVDQGELVIGVSDGYVSDERRIDLTTMVSRDGAGNEFAYQAGGIWRLDGDRSTLVSKPDLRYYTETNDGERVGRIDVSPVTVSGSVGAGEQTVRKYDETSFESLGEDIKYVNFVTVEVVDSPYHDGWYDFLKEEFEATDEDELAGQSCDVSGSLDENVICHDEANRTVTVVAGIDGETPLRNLVGIEPTVYGGMYISGGGHVFDRSITVTGYDDHRRDSNVTEDFLVADYDWFDLHNHADIAGIPVVNGVLGSRGNPEISPLGYGVDVNEGPNGRQIADQPGYYLDAHENALAAELSGSYETVDPIDDEIETVRRDYLDGEPAAGGDVTAGFYDGVGSDIDTLDSSAGDVHIAVADDLELSNVEVSGANRTSIYVDGADIDLSDVEITPDDRASALWIYATSDSTVTIDGDFQGVVYAPGADLEIADGTRIDGAVVAGDGSRIGDGVHVNFDRTLRTDRPISKGDENLLFEYGDVRGPLDAAFVLDRSGSMGPHNPHGNTYRPVDTVRISGDDWEPIPVDEPFRNVHRLYHGGPHHDVEVRNITTGETARLELLDHASPENWDEIRVLDETCYWGRGHYRRCFDDAEIGVYEHPGNDPAGARVDATRNFIDLMNESHGDRVGVYEFDDDGNVLYTLDDDLEAAKNSVSGTAYGGTNMAAGLKLALDDYERDNVDGQERVVVLLSDGENSYPRYDDAMDAQIARAIGMNVTVHTVGLDGLEHASIPEGKLENWATQTGGSFYSTDDADELFDLFETIAKEEVEVDTDTRVQISVTVEPETTSRYAVSVSERTVEIDS